MWEPEQEQGGDDLERGVDYLWCPACKIHVRCIRNEGGWWEVQCPNCIGECGWCKCHLREFCFGYRKDAPPLKAGMVTPACPHTKK